MQGGLEDEQALAALVADKDAVLHVAGTVRARTAEEFARVNRDGAARLACAALRAGVSPFVLVSSQAATGPSRRGETLDETSGPGPLTAYGRSKLAGEQVVRETGVPLSVVRPPAVYGPGDRALLGLFRLAVRGIVPLFGDGAQELTLVHARDLARALVAVVDSAATVGGVYHAGNAAPVTQRALAVAVGRAVGREVRCLALPPGVVRPLLGVFGLTTRALNRAPLLDRDKSRELLASGWVCSSAALRRDTGWEAEIALADGLAETADAYREAGWLP